MVAKKFFFWSYDFSITFLAFSKYFSFFYLYVLNPILCKKYILIINNYNYYLLIENLYYIIIDIYFRLYSLILFKFNHIKFWIFQDFYKVCIILYHIKFHMAIYKYVFVYIFILIPLFVQPNLSNLWTNFN